MYVYNVHVCAFSLDLIGYFGFSVYYSLRDRPTLRRLHQVPAKGSAERGVGAPDGGKPGEQLLGVRKIQGIRKEMRDAYRPTRFHKEIWRSTIVGNRSSACFDHFGKKRQQSHLNQLRGPAESCHMKIAFCFNHQGHHSRWNMVKEWLRDICKHGHHLDPWTCRTAPPRRKRWGARLRARKSDDAQFRCRESVIHTASAGDTIDGRQPANQLRVMA